MKALLIGLLIISAITIVFAINYDNDNIDNSDEIRIKDPNMTEKKLVDKIQNLDDDYIPEDIILGD